MVFVGVDLGQRQDPTAIVVVEQANVGSLEVRFAERVALGTPYPQVVERVRGIVQSREMVGRCWLTVDATGVGAPVVEMLRGARLGCEICPVTITGGASAHANGTDWSVPKRDLISGLQVLLERDALKIGAKLREAQTLVRELLNMQMTLKSNGGTRMGADGCGEHDDLVIALALACWRAGRGVTRPQPSIFGGGRLPGI
jgi:hypothetical protein